MQPYFFPYLGYYQLAYHVDHFVFFDDVAFRKKSFINRNVLPLLGEIHRFTLPIERLSQNRSIADHFYVNPETDTFNILDRFFHPHSELTSLKSQLHHSVFLDDRNVASVNERTIRFLFQHLDIPFSFSRSSDFRVPDQLRGSQRILHLCELLGATHYINLPGGKALYDPIEFESRGITLQWIQPCLPLPYLSVLHHLIQIPESDLRTQLGKYEMITP